MSANVPVVGFDVPDDYLAYCGRELLYIPTGKVVHIAARNMAMCRTIDNYFADLLHGTGSQDEYDEARNRRLCLHCARSVSYGLAMWREKRGAA